MLSIVIASHNRTELLRSCLQTIVGQNFKDFEVIVAHTGVEDGTASLVEAYSENFKYKVCKNKGAAIQRNEGVQIAKGDWIVFLDDDVLLEPDFLFEISQSIKRNPDVKGVSGRITNQYHEEPGKLFRLLLRMFGVSADKRLDGMVVGPALNFLPKPQGKDEEPIQWMPTCVCAYNRQVILDLGVFPSQFVGYSYGEDLFLSLLTSSKYPIILNRNAKLFHKDIGSTSHKNHYKIAVMQVDNRNYINKVILKKNRIIFNLQLICWNFATVFAQAIHAKLKPSQFFNLALGYVVGFFRNSF
jgi:glycosyltransferase involved in cell wall biosynthesis